LQGLIASQGFVLGAFFLQGVVQVRNGLGDGGLNGIVCGHRGEGRRRRLAIGFSGTPASRAVTLGGQQVVQCIEGEQLTNTGAFAGDQLQFATIVLTNHPQTACQRQDKQQKQQLKLSREAKTPQQPDPR